VRSVKAFPGGVVLTLSENGTIAVLSAPGKSRAKAITGAEKLLLALESGTVTATRSVTAAVSGRFLPGTGRQLAVATFAGHLALIDEATGQLMFDATWPAIHDLSAADLDGDGRDELLVASGRSVTVLGAAAR
jgi:hypothetical protein